MEDWYRDSLARYPRVLLQREQANPMGHASQHVSLPANRGGGNIIRIRVQGRRSGSTELDTPKVTVHRYSQGQSPNSAEPSVTVETVKAGGETLGTAVPIRHITSSPVSHVASTQPRSALSTHYRQPMRAVPLTACEYDCNGNPIDKVENFTNSGIWTRRPPTILPSNSRLLDSFEKEFDKFTAQYTSAGKNPYSRSQTEKTDQSRSYASRRHDSESLSAGPRRRHHSLNTPDDSDHFAGGGVRSPSPSGSVQVPRPCGVVRSSSPNVFCSTHYTNRRAYISPRKPSSPTTCKPDTVNSEEVFHSTKDNIEPASIAKAKWVLDKVLKDLVSKDGMKGRRRNSIVTEARDTIKRVSDELNINDLSRGDDTDSGYSGSGDTTKSGFTFSTLEIKEKIKKYNNTSHGNKLTAVPGQTETFQGDIQICMCLEHPVSMLLNTRPSSLLRSTYDSKGEEERITALATIPENTITKLHVTSEDTAETVIQQLLNKFNIVESPKTYALYEQTLSDEQDAKSDDAKLRKTAHSERPLLNFLAWNTEAREQRLFILKESYSAKILWDSFSIPELSNFVRMLELECKNQAEVIRNKYSTYRRNVQARLTELKPGSIT